MCREKALDELEPDENQPNGVPIVTRNQIEVEPAYGTE